MKYLFLLLLAIPLAGCSINPGGMTDRTDIRARAAVEIERVKKDAAIGVAAAERDAAIGVAEQDTIATIGKHRAWTSTLPTLFLIIGIIVIGSLWINWRGRHTLAHIERGPVVSVALPTARPTQPSLRELQLLAERQGMTIQVEDNIAYLVDAQGEIKGRKMLTG